MRPGNKIVKLNDTTYIIEEFFGMVYGYVLLGKDRAAVIDTGFGYRDYGEAAKSVTDMPVDALITHGHLDHIASNYRFDRVYMHPADEDLYKEHSDRDVRLGYLQGLLREVKVPERPIQSKPVIHFLDYVADIPTKENRVPYEDGDVIDLGGRHLEVIHTPGHTPGSVLLLDVENRDLYTGDTICDEGILLHFDHSCSVKTYRDSILKVKAMSDRFDRMWPAHHKKPIDHGYLDEYIACAEKIMREHSRDEDPADQIAEYGRIKISFNSTKL